MRPNNFLPLLLVCCCLVVVAAIIGSEVTARTDQSLASWVLPDPQGQVMAAPVQVQVEQEIPLEALPETSGAWHLSLFLHDNWRQRSDEVALVTMFSTEPRLVHLKKQMHTHVYTPSNPLFSARYAKSFPRLPGVMLQKPDGNSIYKVGAEIPVPQRGGELANKIIQAIKERFPCPRPRPKPTPDETPTPDTDGIPDMPVPDVSPDVDATPVVDIAEDTELSREATWGIGLVLAAVAGAGALFLSIRDDVRNG